MAIFTTGRAGENGLRAPLLDSMYRLRSDVFHKRLGWEVRVEDGREHDWFDLIGPHYVVAHDGHSHAMGCCRLLPTLGPNMLRDIFPDLLDGAPAPAGASIWEVSRFALCDEHAQGGFGFSGISSSIIAEVFRFIATQDAESLVGVTSAPFERMMRHMGLHVERLGKPRRIGKVMSLAFRMPVAENLIVIGGPTPTTEVAHAA